MLEDAVKEDSLSRMVEVCRVLLFIGIRTKDFVDVTEPGVVKSDLDDDTVSMEDFEPHFSCR